MVTILDPLELFAHDVKVAFREMLPNLYFRFYRSTMSESPSARLYVFGYGQRWQLIGGYTFEIREDALRVSLQLLSAIQFFHKAAVASNPRFYPPSLQTMYQEFRHSKARWQPLLYLPESIWA